MEKGTDYSTRRSYKQILKSTFVMGGSSVISTLLGILRTKVLALIIGPAGLGLTGICMSTISMGTAICGMGIGESGVRQIAAAMESGDRTRISRTVLSVKRSALIYGIAGSCLLLIFCNPVGLLTFGGPDHALDLALLTFAIFLGAISGGQLALIQGMRRIGDLAKISIFGALWGTLFSIPVVYLLGEKGVSSFLLIATAMTLLTSWWYSRKLDTPKVDASWRTSLSDSKPLLRLGFAFMSASLMIFGITYILRVLVLHYHGMAAAGIYQAAAMLSSVYVGIILRAMLTDFYPRLTAAANDPEKLKSLVNHQIEVGVLLAVPGILATMTLAPFVILLFYTPEFLPSIELLRWQILGVFLQVISWPMGFILRAKGNGRLFFWTEVFANGTHLILAWTGIVYVGLTGIGMAFFLMNLLYGALIFLIVCKHYEFIFSEKNVQLLSVLGLAVGVVFATPMYFPKHHLIINGGITFAAGFFSLKSLVQSTELMPGVILKIRSRLTVS